MASSEVPTPGVKGPVARTARGSSSAPRRTLASPRGAVLEAMIVEVEGPPGPVSPLAPVVEAGAAEASDVESPVAPELVALVCAFERAGPAADGGRGGDHVGVAPHAGIGAAQGDAGAGELEDDGAVAHRVGGGGAAGGAAGRGGGAGGLGPVAALDVGPGEVGGPARVAREGVGAGLGARVGARAGPCVGGGGSGVAGVAGLARLQLVAGHDRGQPGDPVVVGGGGDGGGAGGAGGARGAGAGGGSGSCSGRGVAGGAAVGGARLGGGVARPAGRDRGGEDEVGIAAVAARRRCSGRSTSRRS